MRRNTLLLLSIGLVAVALVVGFVLMNNRNTDETGLESVPVDTNTNEVVDLEQVEISLSDEERSAAEERDRQRLEDVEKIQDALKEFKDAKGNYPETLDELVPDYLDAIPENPSPGGEAYSYTPIGTAPYAFYDVGYSLEVGVNDVTVGSHTANPEGIAEP